MSNYRITNSNMHDLDASCQLFVDAIAYQKRKGYPEYRCDDRVLQQQDIENRQHYKVVLGNELAAIFTMWFMDEKIWRERDQGKSIYLHRIVTSQQHKGQNLLGRIIKWVNKYAMKNNKSSIRIDTWSDNPSLINYYEQQGFELVEYFQIPKREDIPLNCRGNRVALMEYNVTKNK